MHTCVYIKRESRGHRSAQASSPASPGIARCTCATLTYFFNLFIDLR